MRIMIGLAIAVAAVFASALFSVFSFGATQGPPAVSDIYLYEQTDVGNIPLGRGSDNDVLENMIVATLSTAQANQVSIRRSGGLSAFQVIVPAGSAIGVYPIKFDVRSVSGGFVLVKSGGSTVTITGKFRR